MSAGKPEAKALAKKSDNPLTQWEIELNQRRVNLQKALPDSYPVDRFIHAAKAAVAKNQKLLQCDRLSLYQAVYTAAELGLVPNSALGHGWIIPYGKEAQWVTGYQGLVFLVGKSGLGTIEQPVLVYQRDLDEGRFILEQGDRRRCRLVGFPKDPSKPKGDVRFAFYTTLLPTGQRKFHVVDRDLLLARRDGSKGYQNAIQYKKDHPWISAFDPMCMKTVIRDGAKFEAKSGDDVWSERLGRAIEYEDAEEATWHREPAADGVTGNDVLRSKIKGANPALVEDAQIDISNEPEDPAHVAQNEAASREPGSEG